MVGSVIVGIAIKLAGAGQAAAGLDNISIASRRAALSLDLAKKQISSLDAAIARNALTNESLALRQQRIMDRTAQQAMRTRAMVAGAFALGGAAAIIAGIDQAAKFEQAMVSVRIATGASADEFARLQRLVMATSGVTAQSSVTIASELAAAASSGLNNPQRLMGAFPQLARAADVLWLGPKHIDAVESVIQLSKLSHLFGAYSGAPLHNMVDAAVRMMYVQPDTLSRLINQGKYFIPTALAAGVSMKDIFTESMSMAQLGLMSGRGGTSLRSYMQFLLGSPMITEYRSKKQLQGFEALGLYNAAGRNRFVRPDGTLDLEASLNYLAARRRQMRPSDFVTDLFMAFGQQGAQYIIPRTAQYAMAQAGQNAIALRRFAPPGQAVESAWEQYMHTTIGAWNLFTTNFRNVGQAVFLPTLPAITTGLRDFAGQLQWLTGVFMDHPWAGWTAAGSAIVGVSSSALYAAASLAALNRSILAMGSAAGGTSITAGGMFARWLPYLGTLATIGASIALIAGDIKWFRDRFGGGSSNVSRRQALKSDYPIQHLLYRHQTLQQYMDRMIGPGAYEMLGVPYTDFIARSGRYRTGAGGLAFNDDRLRRVFQQHLSAPLVQALTGASSTSVADTQRVESNRQIAAIHELGDRLEAVMEHLGITINVPGQPPMHRTLVPPGSGGGHSPIHSNRRGMHQR